MNWNRLGTPLNMIPIEKGQNYESMLMYEVLYLCTIAISVNIRYVYMYAPVYY